MLRIRIPVRVLQRRSYVSLAYHETAHTEQRATHVTGVQTIDRSIQSSPRSTASKASSAISSVGQGLHACHYNSYRLRILITIR